MASSTGGLSDTGYCVYPITRCTPGPLPFWSSLPGVHLQFLILLCLSCHGLSLLSRTSCLSCENNDMWPRSLLGCRNTNRCWCRRSHTFAASTERRDRSHVRWTASLPHREVSKVAPATQALNAPVCFLDCIAPGSCSAEGSTIRANANFGKDHATYTESLFTVKANAQYVERKTHSVMPTTAGGFNTTCHPLEVMTGSMAIDVSAVSRSCLQRCKALAWRCTLRGIGEVQRWRASDMSA